MSIEDVVNNDDLTITEKYIKLDELVEDYKTRIEFIKQEITKGCRFCSKCGEHYKLSAWETGIRTVMKNRCKNPLTGGYLDNYEYENVEENEIYYECPRGHKIANYYGC